MTQQTSCINMIKQQLRTGGVLNEKILDLYNTIPREDFVPEFYQPFAYSDLQIPLANQQRMFTPLEEALILQSLELNGTEKVLEIGTGCGFLTALLSKLSDSVVSVEYFPDIANLAHQNLQKHSINNVELISGDASQGMPELGPFDVIIYSGSMPRVNHNILSQLHTNGKIINMIGESPVIKVFLTYLNNTKLIFETDIPKLITKLPHGSFIF